MSWTEELKARTGVSFYAAEPEKIEERSLAIIREELGREFVENCPADQLSVLSRVIHATADFSYRETLFFTPGVLDRARECLRRGLPIVTDTTMAASGINKRAAARLGSEVHCFIGDADVAERARESRMTRSAVSVDKAAGLYPDCIYVVGNAPTALMRLYELHEEGKIRPGFVIGVPVGFVNVVEAKELLERSGLPAIVARGRRGGSNVAAAVMNALLYQAGGR
ncbi:MAG: precorrin-8X methylmutase [Lachnospiraceae bacterium]|jgi:precorrin-8X/cobalt-precorrin-8 methylmutase|nr:precorrin-8X methylmutase [Lachnospiraceae bacterium]